MVIAKSWHCAYEIHYHIVFPVKYRKALIRPDIERELLRIADEIHERYEIVFEQIGADRDDIHLLCSAHPKISIGEIVRIYKSITARELFLTFPDLKKELWGGEFWSDGYYAATVGQRNNWETVFRYVKNQGKEQAKTLRCFTQLTLPDLST
jgi:putative transposase